jgi:hypothetical protein
MKTRAICKKNPYQKFEFFISFNWYKNEKGVEEEAIWLQIRYKHCTTNFSLSSELLKKPLQHILYIINTNVNNRYNINQQMCTLRYNYNNVFIHANSYMFPTSLAHNQGVQRCIKHLIINSSMWNCLKFINVSLM